MGFHCWGGLLNHIPPEIFIYVQHSFLNSSRDRLVMACASGDRHRGLGADTMAGLRAIVVVE